ncbi:hypothetical protein [Burkholderia cenocepacia]|uniref:hypothetical protein n=1 Tax=Burkholderia cenocepacia TaxID=95486 RepID=UPI00285B53CE|nr:hypothetical protein [Burkholderia cenocepacia]MDR5647529.1 hypothetical protein [Burkholderia cenocepacia]
MDSQRRNLLVPEGPDSDLVKCRICRMSFSISNPAEVRNHREEHLLLAKGVLPEKIREILTGIGYGLATDDGSISQMQAQFSSEDGCLAVAFSAWSGAIRRGVASIDFDEFIWSYLEFVDAATGRSGVPVDEARALIDRWRAPPGWPSPL